MDPTAPQPKPILYWDRDCNFCRCWVERWHQATGKSTEYEVVQSAPARIVEAAGGLPPKRIVLARPGGALVTGGEAALAALAPHSLRARGCLALYHAIAPFRAATEAAYHFVAGRREVFAFLTKLLWGPDALAPSYALSGWIFPRALGLVFLCAFASLWVQIDGLAGSGGILPVAEHLAAVENYSRSSGGMWRAWQAMPSLLWFGASDAHLHAWLAAGTAASLLLALGIMPAAAAAVAWACYLSFAATLPVFLNFQWDALLLEAGLLAALYVPWRRFLARGSSEPSRWGRLLVWWLLFRLMFESGVVKLHGYNADGINAWLDGTALDFHYFTQPIPVWTSWWAAQLPGWFQRLSLLGLFIIELVLPFFIFGPRRMRMTAFWGFTFLMVVIMATGHYGFFNLLTLALCLTLVDDASWPAPVRRLLASPAQRRPLPRTQRILAPWLAAVIVVPATCTLLLVMRALPPAWAGPLLGPFMLFRSTNSYGLFSVMTVERPEITIEASTDGITWQPCRFPYKMEAAASRLPFLLPHMPRLDWQMWFAALEYRERGQPPAWMMPFLARLQEGSPAVKGLLLPDGAAQITPRFFRLRLELLNFTTPEERRNSGRVWTTEPLPSYTIEGSLQPGPR
ncbi:MAG: lipase maturation factor family protein [Chthoniobacterales bacterium]|nr:lipase maturation factor family protein [Chthoniobacterales bacterium]